MDEVFPPEQYRQDPADLELFDAAHLQELALATMPYGKYAGWRLVDLPEPYLVWFKQNGFPEGTLGRHLAEVCEIKANGLEFLFYPLRS